MPHTNTIEKFINSLIENSVQEFPKIIKKSTLSLHDLVVFESWKSNDYTRNCIARNDKFELILLCWEPGAKTPIHDHGGQDCWVYQIKGTIEEVRYNQDGNKLEETNRITLYPGDLTFMNDKMDYHTIENNSDLRAMSLHIYACPIDKCKVFNGQTDCFEIKELSYHSSQAKKVEIGIL